MGQGEEVKSKSEAQVEIQVCLSFSFIIYGTYCYAFIFFFYRPKVEKEEAHSPDNVQRLYLVLGPESSERPVEEKQSPHSGSKKGSSSTDHDGGSSSDSAGKNGSEGGRGNQLINLNIEKEPLLRLTVMGRKSLPDQEYDTAATRGYRQKYPARALGEGIYRIPRHNNPGKRMHTHLVYRLELPSKDKEDEPQESLNIKREGSFIIHKNPDQHGGSPQFTGLQNKRKARFPAHLQGQFGHNKTVHADRPDMLNYERLMGMELKTECEGDDDPASCSDLVKTLGETAPTSPLLEAEGTWA
uniref:Uncharacterized protein n=1 Tax=Populus trichocarpa TaxID=3694 RepID=A0A2K2AVX9_POPTR